MEISIESLGDLLLVIVVLLIPGLLLIAVLTLLFRNMLRREEMKARYRIRMKAFTEIMPLRIAAYERATLLLERIHPVAMLNRVDPSQTSAEGLKTHLLGELKTEYEHNVVQQLYISDGGWKGVLAVRNETQKFIQQAYEAVGGNASGVKMAEKMLQLINEEESETWEKAIRRLKRDSAGFLSDS